MADVIDLPTITTLDLPPERVLGKALEAGLTGAIVIGYDAAGDEYIASSYGDAATMLWLMERAKKRLLEDEP